jgi:Phosphoserine phosphatase RsbU, N-terminal domain
MSCLMTLRRAYGAAFEAYLAEPGEEALRAAYELGRDAVARELSVLDLATVHHEAIRTALASADARRVADAGAEFFLESVSAFEMLQRGFRETQEAARTEQRQAALLRRLSSFLGDASLAFTEAESLEEMLQLVAEQARELIGAECCLVLASPDDGVRVEAVAGSWDVGDGSALFKLASLLRPPGGTARLTEADLADDPAAIAVGDIAGHALRGLLAAPLTALDGAELGSIHLFEPTAATSFGDVHEAQLLHLTQLASAAVERVALYGQGRRVADALRRARHDDRGPPDVVVKHRCSEAGGAVWFDTTHLDGGRLALVAGEVRGPAPAVAAVQARAAARALLAGGAGPRALVAGLAELLDRLAPDNPSRAAAVVVAGDQAQTAVDGVGEATISLGAGTTLVVHVGGGAPPAVAVEVGGAEAAAGRVFAAFPEAADAEAAVLAVFRPT